MNIQSVTIKLLFLLVIMSGISCSDDDKDDTTVIEQEKNLITARVTAGTWRITKFIDSGDDEMHHFTGFNFTFRPEGRLIATKPNTTYNGSWGITPSSSNDDDNTSNYLDFNIMFNLANEFEDLNEDWDIISHSPTKIELNHISGGNGGIDYLTFEKN